MAFKLTKAQSKRLQEYRDSLGRRKAAIEVLFEEMKAKLPELTKDLNEAIHEYNADVDEMKAFAEEVASEHRDAYDEKSENWKEGDRGTAVSEFVEAWEAVDLDEIDEIEIVEPDEPDFDGISSLDDLPEEAES